MEKLICSLFGRKVKVAPKLQHSAATSIAKLLCLFLNTDKYEFLLHK